MSARVSLKALKYIYNFDLASINGAKRLIFAANLLRRSRHRHARLSGRHGNSIGRKLRCLFKGSGTNRRCIRGTRPSLRCRRAGRRARLPWCGYRGPGRGGADLAGGQDCRRRGWRRGRCCAMRTGSRSTMRWCCGFRDRRARPARTSPNFMSMADARCWRRCSRRCRRFADVRAAEPGEFTRRAFENGKLDLTEAEGLDDLIHADTDRQRRQALRQLKGLLGDRARDWRAQIIEASALDRSRHRFLRRGRRAGRTDRAGAGEDRRRCSARSKKCLRRRGEASGCATGLVVAIAGPPNVGKSTLMNQLARREVAIVSPHAGTTRDVIEVQLDLDGYPVTVIDTAGIRETDDPVEQEGVRRARARAAEADLVLWLTDARARHQHAARGRGAGVAGAQQDRSGGRAKRNDAVARRAGGGRADVCGFRRAGAMGSRS